MFREERFLRLLREERLLRLCFGIYDTKCDGATEESPVKLIKALVEGIVIGSVTTTHAVQSRNAWGVGPHGPHHGRH